MDELDLRIRNHVSSSFVRSATVPGFPETAAEPGLGLTGSFWRFASSRGTLGPRSAKGGHGLRTILVVDDESNIRFLVRVTLENAGYDVIEAHHGVAALERAKQGRPQLIVTDLMMPVMGGRELIERLRADPETATIPILVLSGNAGLLAGGADAALPKPFDPQALIESVLTLAEVGDAP